MIYDMCYTSIHFLRIVYRLTLESRNSAPLSNVTAIALDTISRRKPRWFEIRLTASWSWLGCSTPPSLIMTCMGCHDKGCKCIGSEVIEGRSSPFFQRYTDHISRQKDFWRCERVYLALEYVWTTGFEQVLEKRRWPLGHLWEVYGVGRLQKEYTLRT